MIGKIVKVICEIVIFAGVLWNLRNDWVFYQYFDLPILIINIIIVMISSGALTLAIVELIREIRQRHREKEKKRIGPDL